MTGLSSYKKSIAAQCHSSAKKSGFSDIPALTHEFLSAAFDLGAALTDETIALIAQVPIQKSICSVPTYGCTDAQLGEISRKAYVGEQIRVPVKIKNATKKSRSFNFTAPNPLKNIKGDLAESLNLSVSQINLDAAQIAVLNLTLMVSDRFQPGFDYIAKIDVTSEGCDPQFLTFVLKVLSDDFAPMVPLDCPCNPPIRRTHWSDHFYCDQPKETER